jgi:hypothetical protein
MDLRPRRNPDGSSCGGFLLHFSLLVSISPVSLITLPLAYEDTQANSCFSPENAKWITDEERHYITARLAADQGDNAEDRKVTFHDFINLIKDPKIWLGGLMYMGQIVTAYSIAFFAPTIIQGYGFGAIESQLRSVPPYACSFILSMIVAYASDRHQHRFAYVLAPTLLSFAGFGILLSRSLYAVGDVSGRDTRYAALFLLAMGTFSSCPVLLVWFQLNLGGHHRRGMGTAFQIAFGNLAGFVSTYSFISTDGPFYTPGFAVCVAFQGMSFLSACIYAGVITWENKRKNKVLDARDLATEEKRELGVSLHQGPKRFGRLLTRGRI